TSAVTRSGVTWTSAGRGLVRRPAGLRCLAGVSVRVGAGVLGRCRRFSTRLTSGTALASPSRRLISSGVRTSPRSQTTPPTTLTSMWPLGTVGSRNSSVSTLRAIVTSSRAFGAVVRWRSGRLVVARRLGDSLAAAGLGREAVVGQVERADRAGLDLVGIQDHPYQRRFLETFSLLAFLAARTSRIRLFPDVANLPLRRPAVLAKAGATIDLLSGGRFELGLGAGAFWEAIGALGGPVRSPGESVEALEEAIAVIRAMWSGERSVSFDGSHYSLSGLHPGPAPAHPIGIWLGAYGPRMVRLTGRL